MDSDFAPPKRPGRSGSTKPDTNTQTENSQAAPAGESFRTPGEIAAEQDLQSASAATTPIEAPISHKQPSSANWRDKLALHWPPGKKEWAVAAVVLLLCGLGIFLATHHSKKPAPTPKKAVAKVVKPTTVPSTLTGLPVDPSVNKRTVTGVMIENSTDARPQSGLSQAGVVFEAVAEGGVTRFMALYQDTSPDNVGPIRSARPYYIQWALGFDAGYAHVGGSPDGLADIKAWSVRDLDQFANSGAYHRVTSRAAPHNVYTSIATLNQLEAAKGYTTSTYTGFVRKLKQIPSKQPNPRTIDLTLSGPAYNVHYDYNSVANSYNRSEGGASHNDANTNTEISPKVVIAMVIPEHNGALDSSNAYYSEYAVIGSGPVYIFQDGTVITGTWTKSANTSQITFTNAAGQPIQLDPGQTWLTAVSATSKVSYTP